MSRSYAGSHPGKYFVRPALHLCAHTASVMQTDATSVRSQWSKSVASAAGSSYAHPFPSPRPDSDRGPRHACIGHNPRRVLQEARAHAHILTVSLVTCTVTLARLSPTVSLPLSLPLRTHTDPNVLLCCHNEHPCIIPVISYSSVMISRECWNLAGTSLEPRSPALFLPPRPD